MSFLIFCSKSKNVQLKKKFLIEERRETEREVWNCEEATAIDSIEDRAK